MISFENKKQEFIYYVKRAQFFEGKNQDEVVKCLKQAELTLNSIELANKKTKK